MIFGKRAGTIHSHTLSVCAQVPAARQAVAAAPADHMTFAAHHFAGMKIAYVRSRGNNFAHELVPDRHGNRDGGTSPIVPLVDMQISPTNSCMRDSNQDVVDPDRRFGDVFKP